jgi:hypothetical protein
VFNRDQRPAIRKVAILCEERGWMWACHAIVHAMEAWATAEDRYDMARKLRQLHAEPVVQPLDLDCRTCLSAPGECCSVLNDGGNRVVPHPVRVQDADARNAGSHR